LTWAVGGESYLPPAPRLQPELLFNNSIPASDRMKLIALAALSIHYDRFAAERKAAISQVTSAPARSDILRRAAFWELRDVNIETPGGVALRRLAQDGDESTQRFLLGITLGQHMDDEALDIARTEIQAGHQIFIAGLFAHLANHRDNNAQWVARILCQENQKQVIPVMLDWLKDNGAQVRKVAALNLCWLPSPDTVPGLLNAIRSENDLAVKSQMIEALAQTGDQRGLETLIEAATESTYPDDKVELVRGLGRIRDPKALPVLAEIVDARTQNNKTVSQEGYLLPDAVNAFGYISHLYKSQAPDDFGSSSGIDQAQLKIGIGKIEEWRKSQASN
jgi:hypothetical protein